ncbi:hypothetical protein Nepgr_026200 [Nepenthes gracilis]|uniref:Uncharacterized protein n=1 Tax=Nepenthes gracilis TaxID=150966 RepID=A0AAD3Y067_NEPGR|nr:hypothetical protein Nepgr_026200 [Nepenthes gracilis]
MSEPGDCVTESSGRGALPSEGGSLSDLLFLDCGGIIISSSSLYQWYVFVLIDIWQLNNIAFYEVVLLVGCVKKCPKMLRIKRVPTVVSNYQQEADGGAQNVEGCGRKCPREYCIQGAKLPLYGFRRMNKTTNENRLIAHDDARGPLVAFLDTLLGEWEDRMQRGLFRYDVTAC